MYGNEKKKKHKQKRQREHSMKTTGMFLIAVCAASFAHGQTVAEREKQAYCQYVMDGAAAEKTLATGVQGLGRFGQSDSNPTEKQAVVGVSKSLSKHLQGNAAMRAAELDCRLYAQTVDLGRAVKYRMAAVERDVATQRVQDLQRILQTTDEEIVQANARKRSGNATLADVVSLTQRRQQIYSQYMSARDDANKPGIPEVPSVDMDAAIQSIETLTLDLQDELNRKQKLQAWDVSVVVGMQKPISGQPSGSSTNARPFASLAFNYNLNAIDYGRKLEAATASMMALRREQNDELFHQVDVMRKAIEETRNLLRTSQPTLDAEVNRLNEELASVRDIDSAEAWRVRAHLRLNLMTAEMDQRLARLRAERLAEPPVRERSGVDRVTPIPVQPVLGFN
jgi:hypothetical protein